MTPLRTASVALVMAIACGAGTPAGVQSTPGIAPGAPVDIEMRNVHLRADAGIVIDVKYLRGLMVSRVKGQPPAFDDPDSYVLRVATGEVSMDLVSLQTLLNQRVFAGPHAPLTDVHVSIDKDGRLKQSATLHKGPIPLPVSMKATVGVSPDGRLLLHVETEKTLGIPTTGLLALFGLKVDDLVHLKDTRGVEIDDNDVLITPGQVVPPPQIQGRLASATIRGNRLVQTFARDPELSAAPLHPTDRTPNDIYFSGAVLRFGKLTMTGADLQLVDENPKTPFDFFPREYFKQLVAGYSKTTKSGGLVTHMPDYGTLK